MKRRHTLPLFAICAESGPVCVNFEDNECLPVYRTLGLAQSFLTQSNRPDLHIESFETSEDVIALVNTAKQIATHVLWNTSVTPDYVAQSSVQEMLDLYAT